MAEEPLTFKEGISSNKSENGMGAMKDGMDSLIKNKIGILVNKRKHTKLLTIGGCFV